MSPGETIGESCSQPPSGEITGRQSEPEQALVPVEAAHPDVTAGECIVQPARVPMANQPVERRAAANAQSRLSEKGIEFGGLPNEPPAHRLREPAIAQSSGADLQRRACHTPRAERLAHQGRDVGPGNEAAEPQPGKAVELAEGAQDEHRKVPAQRRSRSFRHHVDEGFVQNQPAAAPGQVGGHFGQPVTAEQMPVGVVGIDHDQMPGRIGKGLLRAAADELVPGATPGQGVLGIGRLHDGDRAVGGEVRQPLNEALGPRCGDDRHILGNPIGLARRGQQAIQGALRRQAGPGFGRQASGHRPGEGVDARGEIEPRGTGPAMDRHRRRQIATMLHGPSLPWLSRLGQMLAVVAGIAAMALPLCAQPLPRVASINMCTDQLLVDLARPEQIAGLSPFARDRARSWVAAKAADFPILSGTAEEILVLRPDLVVAGTFTRRETREFIRARRLRIEEFPVARTVADARSQILRMAALVGAEARGRERAVALDAAMERLRTAARGQPLRVLPLARRGWVAGQDSILTDLLKTAGLTNAAGESGRRAGGFMSLEEIVKLRPDAILVGRDDDRAEDQGRAMLLHPAIAALFPPERRILMSESLTVCGGPMLVEAIDGLAAQLSALGPRRAAPR